MATIRLDYVHSFTDVRNKLRHVFRRNGRTTTIKGRVGSEQFMSRYAELLAASESVDADVGMSRFKSGTIDAVVLHYLADGSFTKLARTTRAMRRPILDQFRDHKTPSGRRFGDNEIRGLMAQDIAAVLKGRSATMQKSILKAIRGLLAFAISEGVVKRDVTVGIRTMRPARSDGHLTWGDNEIERYRDKHTVGSMARLALELMLNTAARRDDARLLGRQHLRNGCLSWRPGKTARTTGKLLTIPVLPELQAALDAMPRSDELTFLLTEQGLPFASSTALGNRFASWCEAAGLKSVPCGDGKVRSFRAHGLRKAACKLLAEAGATGPEIMSISGHATLAQVQVYIAGVEQDRMAKAAMTKLAAGTKRSQVVDNIHEKDG